MPPPPQPRTFKMMSSHLSGTPGVVECGLILQCTAASQTHKHKSQLRLFSALRQHATCQGVLGLHSLISEREMITTVASCCHGASVTQCDTSRHLLLCNKLPQTVSSSNSLCSQTLRGWEFRLSTLEMVSFCAMVSRTSAGENRWLEARIIQKCLPGHVRLVMSRLVQLKLLAGTPTCDLSLGPGLAHSVAAGFAVSVL